MELEFASARFFEVLCERWGLRASRYRDSILARRQAACLRAIRVASPAEGARIAAVDAAESERALNAVMIGVTAFFRDPGVFEALRPLLRPLRKERPLRVLSIGCSDGAELYSLAMLLAEEGLLDGARLEGIDCRPAAIRAARDGCFSAAALESVPVELRTKYFVPVRPGGGARAPAKTSWRIGAELGRACRWTVADAFGLRAHVAPPDACDLVLCRNLAIYLTPESTAELWALCAANLSPGGLLVSGKAERPGAGDAARFRRVGACIHRRDSAP